MRRKALSSIRDTEQTEARRPEPWRLPTNGSGGDRTALASDRIDRAISVDPPQLISQAIDRIETETVRLYLRSHPNPRPLDRSRALHELSSSPTVLFLCLGNICRSPMAERYLQARADAVDLDVSVRSAGFITREGRPSPAVAVETAREFGVDLSDHRSTTVTRDLLEASDLVFVMDVRNHRRLRREYPDVETSAYFLNTFGDGGIEITDPNGEDIARFRVVYGEIAAAIDGIVRTVRE